MKEVKFLLPTSKEFSIARDAETAFNLWDRKLWDFTIDGVHYKKDGWEGREAIEELFGKSWTKSSRISNEIRKIANKISTIPGPDGTGAKFEFDYNLPKRYFDKYVKENNLEVDKNNRPLYLAYDKNVEHVMTYNIDSGNLMTDIPLEEFKKLSKNKVARRLVEISVAVDKDADIKNIADEVDQVVLNDDGVKSRIIDVDEQQGLVDFSIEAKDNQFIKLTDLINKIEDVDGVQSALEV